MASRTTMILSGLYILAILLSEVRMTSLWVLGKTSSCSCVYDGGYYNLRSLAVEEGPAMVALTKDGFEYGYNPCIPFTLGGACTRIAVCRWADSDPNSYVALGRQDNVTCRPVSGQERDVRVALIYHQPGKDQKGWITTIQLKCNKSKDKPIFTVIEDTAIPILRVEHKCCCPNLCPDLSPLPTQSPSSMLAVEMTAGIGGGVLLVILVAFGIRKCRNQKIPDINKQRGGYGALNAGYENGHVNHGDNVAVDGDDVDHEGRAVGEEHSEALEEEQDRDEEGSQPIQVTTGREDEDSSSCHRLSVSPGPVEHP